MVSAALRGIDVPMPIPVARAVVLRLRRVGDKKRNNKKVENDFDLLQLNTKFLAITLPYASRLANDDFGGLSALAFQF